jgi:hypothetical protein
MLYVLTPTEERRRRIQEREGAFYWSACAEGALRRHRLINVRTVAEGRTESIGDPADAFLIVTRGVEELPRSPAGMAVEGPLSERVADALGLRAHNHELRSAIVTGFNPRCAPGALSYPLCWTKPIRRTSSEPHEKERLYAGEDPRWSNRTVRFQSFEHDGSWEPFANVRLDGVETAVTGVRRRGVVVFGAPIFDILGASMAFAPLSHGYFKMETPSVAPYQEIWAVDQIREAALGSGTTVVSPQAWPDDRSWALTIRHDWDRPARLHEIADLLLFYARRRLKASFGFIHRRTPAREANVIRTFGHEVNLHATAWSSEEFAEQVRTLERLTRSSVKGFHTHGGMGAPGFLGDALYDWAEPAGLDYVEILGRAAFLPACVNRIVEDLPAPTRLVAPAVHLSIDAGTKPEQHNHDDIVALFSKIRAIEGQAVVMNHPDVHLKELKSALRTIEDGDAPWCATLEQATAWFRSTRGGPQVTLTGTGLRVAFPEPLRWDCSLQVLRGGETRRVEAVRGSASATLELAEAV